jgi:hypothetical protein
LTSNNKAENIFLGRTSVIQNRQGITWSVKEPGRQSKILSGFESIEIINLPLAAAECIFVTFSSSTMASQSNRGQLEPYKRPQRTPLWLPTVKNSSSAWPVLRKITVLLYISRKARVQESDIFLPVYSFRALDLHSYWQKCVIRVQSQDPYVIYMRISDSLYSGCPYVHEKVVIATIVFNGNMNFFVLYLRMSISDEVKRSPWGTAHNMYKEVRIIRNVLHYTYVN